MQAVWIENPLKSIEEARLQRIPKPELKPGHALVKIMVAAANPTERLIFAALPLPGWSFPTVCGVDFSGVVEGVSDDVKNVQVGDAVFAVNWSSGRNDSAPSIGGAFAEYISIAAYKLSKKPEALSFEQAATLGCIGVTAFQSILDVGCVSRGTKLLVLGGSTAVGSLAIQLGKHLGAYVVTTASTRAFSFVQQFNVADKIINYNEKRWEEDPEVKDFDVIIDCSPEKGTLAKAPAGGVVRTGGKYINLTDFSYGFDPTAHPSLSWAAFYPAHQDTANQDFIADLVVKGKLRIPVESRFPFTQEGVTDLLQKMLGGKSLGKNLLIISQ
jgi:NADPH:quinone reductase-like Zn-dependent oxidoreductase